MIPNIIKESAKGYQSLSINDTLLQERKIFFTHDVNPDSCNDLLEQLMYLECEAPGEEITLYINSPGGDVSSGLAVYDFIRLMSSPVKTVCIGTAASMGSILFLAGDKREMLTHAKIMIHDPSYSNGDYGGMKPLEIQEKVNNLMEIRKELCSIIAERTGKSIKEVHRKTKCDTYFNAEEALAFGIATSIITELTRKED